MKHNRGHEERLAAALAADPRAGNAPDIDDLLRGCGECRDRWLEMEPAAVALRQAAASRRTGLEELATAGSAPGEDRVAETLARLAAPQRSRRRLQLVLAAAAVFALAFLGNLALRSGPKEPVGPTYLGDERLTLVEPVGEVKSFERFAWKFDAAAGGASRPAASYRLDIYDASHPEEDPLLTDPIETLRCRQPSWSPGPEVLDRLPRKILWVVTVLDDGESDRDSGKAQAWLRP